MTAPRLTVLAVDVFERRVRLRLPFRFGVVTITHGRQAILRARIRLDDGREAEGYAAEALGAKWFDKNPALTDAQNVDQLRRAVEIASEAYRAAGPSTAYGLFAASYEAQIARGAAENLNPLVASYGPALLDRAVLDGLCRALGVSFYQAVRSNLPGIVPAAVAPDLAGFPIEPFLAALQPAETILARHTVGLIDPIIASDQPPGTRVDDGLPETLEEVVAAYGQRWFKLKVSGDLAADLDRLLRIATVLDRSPDPYHATLDGNEQYETAAQVAALWAAISGHAGLQRLAASVAFIEQPIKRERVPNESVAALAGQRPLIIDESDGDIDAFRRARALGYAGVSSKTCKGLYKSILNLARCTLWNGDGPRRYFMSAEDLTTQPGISVQQDLALVNLLGLTHVERNAHHFIDGFDERPEAEARAFLAAHPDLYHEQNGRVRLRIDAGRLQLASLDCPGFASAAAPVLEGLERMPRSEWRV
ncbi:MAG: mandelate racemase [Acetobacteraceae bacterium]